MNIRVFLVLLTALIINVYGVLPSQNFNYPNSIQVTITGSAIPNRPGFGWNSYPSYSPYGYQQLSSYQSNSKNSIGQDHQFLIKGVPSYNSGNSAFYTQANTLELFGQTCVPTVVLGTSQNQQRQLYLKRSQTHSIERKTDGAYMCVKVDKPDTIAQTQASSPVAPAQVVSVTGQNQSNGSKIDLVQTSSAVSIEQSPIIAPVPLEPIQNVQINTVETSNASIITSESVTPALQQIQTPEIIQTLPQIETPQSTIELNPIIPVEPIEVVQPALEPIKPLEQPQVVPAIQPVQSTQSVTVTQTVEVPPALPITTQTPSVTQAPTLTPISTATATEQTPILNVTPSVVAAPIEQLSIAQPSIPLIQTPILPVVQQTVTTQSTSQTIVTLPGIQDGNCLDFIGSVCSRCSFRFVLEQGICVPVNPLCATFDASGSCLTCYPGYEICQNGCVIPASTCEQYYPDPNCNVYAPNGTCMSCSNLYYFNTEGLCTQVNPNCKSSDASGNCLTCYAGYHVQNHLCVLTPNEVNLNDLCNRFENGVCVSCAAYSYLNTSTHVCVAISPLCRSSESENGHCLQCYSGYELSRGECILGANNNYPDKLCRQWVNGKCQECSERAYFVNGVCTNVDPLCKAFNSTNGFCQSCFNGYTLTDNKCVLNLDNTFFAGNLCRLWNNGRCIECSQRAVDVNGVCTEVNPLCNSFDHQGNCLTCFSGYLLQNNNCVLAPLIVNTNISNLCFRVENGVCVLCAKRAYLKDSICVEVNPLCSTFDNAGKCESCYIGYILQNGQCNLNAIDFNRDSLCAEFNGSTCVRCATRAYFNNGICSEVNVNCNTFDASTGVCLTCYNGYQLNNGQCIVSQVVLPTPPSSVNLYANIYCKRVDSVGRCTQCFFGFRLENGDCVQEFSKYCKNCKKN